jgi:hypothetical protein
MIKRIIILLKILSKISDSLYMLRWSNRSYLARYTVILVTSRDCSHITWFRNPASVSLLATSRAFKKRWSLKRWRCRVSSSSFERRVLSKHVWFTRRLSDLLLFTHRFLDMRRMIAQITSSIQRRSLSRCSNNVWKWSMIISKRCRRKFSRSKFT